MIGDAVLRDQTRQEKQTQRAGAQIGQRIGEYCSRGQEDTSGQEEMLRVRDDDDPIHLNR